jgi:protein TonB
MFVPPSQVDQPPRRISGSLGAVPDSVKRRKGKVEVEMVITQFGDPTDVRIVRSAGPELDEAVRKAVLGWKFEPARKNGIRVRTRATHSVDFR